VIQRLVRDSDVLAGSLLAGLGVFIVIEARKWDYIGIDGPGPGFFPVWYGLAIIVLSLWLVIGRAIKLRHEDPGGVDWPGMARALGTWAAFALAMALMQPLGFVLSFGLLTFVLVIGLFRRTVRAAFLTASGLSLGFHLVFSVVLNVALPAGFLGF
jgi:putative tricarboxylic transport membrane protein